MRLAVRGHHLPGRHWHNEGEPCDNVHVGVHNDVALVATVDLTDECGAPRCARVGPPAVAWTTDA